MASFSDYHPGHLIYARGVENIAIDGPGDAFFDKDLKPLPRPSPLTEIRDSRGIRIQDLTIRNHIDSCRNTIVSDCHIEAGDDCIVLETSDRGGPAKPLENLTATNCVIRESRTAPPWKTFASRTSP